MDFSPETTLENLKYTIELMEQLQAQKAKLDMRDFQPDSYLHSAKSTLEETVSCGTACCLAGYIAVSPRWQEQGGSLGGLGEPRLYPPPTGCPGFGIYLASKWLGLADEIEADGLFANSEHSSLRYYGCYREDITYPMVIAKLKAILALRQQA